VIPGLRTLSSVLRMLSDIDVVEVKHDELLNQVLNTFSLISDNSPDIVAKLADEFEFHSALVQIISKSRS